MLKESDIATYSIRRTHRTSTREFKAELVAACQQPGVSIAGLASSYGMNANMLHRWLKEHKRSGRHQLIGSGRFDRKLLYFFVNAGYQTPLQLLRTLPGIDLMDAAILLLEIVSAKALS